MVEKGSDNLAPATVMHANEQHVVHRTHPILEEPLGNQCWLPSLRLAIEELMREPSEEYSIIVVIHHMQQAARVSNFPAVLMADDARISHLVEYGESRQIFTDPQDERTEAYITGRFG